MILFNRENLFDIFNSQDAPIGSRGIFINNLSTLYNLLTRLKEYPSVEETYMLNGVDVEDSENPYFTYNENKEKSWYPFYYKLYS